MAFVSDVGIANLALSHVGAATLIESFDEDTEEARQTRAFYHQSRREVLEAYDWNFARRRQGAALHGDTISETATDPLAGVWGFRYQYPADCIVIRKVQNALSPPADATPFDVELSLNGKEKTVLTDMEDAVLVYTSDLEDTPLFSSMFVTSLALLLGSKIAWPLTQKRKLALELFGQYRSTLPAATASNANEQVSPPPRLADWHRDRD